MVRNGSPVFVEVRDAGARVPVYVADPNVPCDLCPSFVDIRIRQTSCVTAKLGGTDVHRLWLAVRLQVGYSVIV